MARRPKAPQRPPASRYMDDEPKRSPLGSAINYGTAMLMAAVLILGIGLGIAFSSTANFGTENVASREVIDRSAPNADICVQYGASAITMDMRAFLTLNPFSVYVSRPVMQPGCVLRSSNWSILEKANVVNAQEVNECRRRLNTFGFTGDIQKGGENVRVTCIYQNDSAQNLFLDQSGLTGTPRETDRF
ncbi:MAG: DUF3172 domain-containing protein [Thermoleptolyngbya sp. C42_A2020_037]|uniref:DUF3172 domain-containing protein n=2 Tax=Cyanophyceae TaxID=3028117 RepID=UPI00074D47D5|nr:MULTISPECIES: DUF3172 domain-containing protein [Cyanophyceae]MBF2084255.1 DUF3172 domain-containing protein [Thermoleptolyngbya sp. C42_A2020_037]BAU43133.1 hypothetical protein O77CONTIG1_02956 [Leptolyngbya sp. O-77]